MGYFKSNSLDVPVDILSIEPYSPLFDRVTVKVMYAGLNRNGSYFSKEAVEYLAKSLPNTPLVGSFDRAAKDFKGHEQTIGFDENNKLKMISNTVPYGVVPADTKVWWQWFDDGGVQRQYLCCEALLWTKRFPEIRETIKAGTSNQSMEIDEDTLVGAWARDAKSGKEFFYVKEAYLLGLCILGKSTQPCFQGANLSKPVNYSAESENFNSMLEELKVALNYEISKKSEGSKKMDNVTLEQEKDIITDANFEMGTEPAAPVDPQLEEILLNKKMEVAGEAAKLQVLEDFVANRKPEDGVSPELGNPQPSDEEIEQGGEMLDDEDDNDDLDDEEERKRALMAKKPEEDIVEPEQPEEPMDNPLEDTVPRPGLEPQKRIEDAKERSAEGPVQEPQAEEPTPPVESPVQEPKAEEPPAPAEDEEDKKKKPPFLQNELEVEDDFACQKKKYEADLSEAYSYIQKLEMELAPLRELKTKCEMQEKMSLLHEFKGTYGEEIETTFAEKLEKESVEQFKASLGLYAFEHRTEVKPVETKVEPIVTYSVKEDNRPSFVKALDAALGRK